MTICHYLPPPTHTHSLLARLHQQNIAGDLPSIDDTGSTISGDNSFMELASKYLAPGERVARSSEFKEVVIDGGGVQNVPMAVVRIGTAIVWEFSTKPKGIAFGIWYKEKKDSQKEVEVSDG